MKLLSFLLKTILPNLTLVFSLSMFTFFVIDQINPAMAFLNNNLTKWLFAFFCIFTLALSLTFLILEEKNKSERK